MRPIATTGAAPPVEVGPRARTTIATVAATPIAATTSDARRSLGRAWSYRTRLAFDAAVNPASRALRCGVFSPTPPRRMSMLPSPSARSIRRARQRRTRTRSADSADIGSATATAVSPVWCAACARAFARNSRRMRAARATTSRSAGRSSCCSSSVSWTRACSSAPCLSPAATRACMAPMA